MYLCMIIVVKAWNCNGNSPTTNPIRWAQTSLNASKTTHQSPEGSHDQTINTCRPQHHHVHVPTKPITCVSHATLDLPPISFSFCMLTQDGDPPLMAHTALTAIPFLSAGSCLIFNCFWVEEEDSEGVVSASILLAGLEVRVTSDLTAGLEGRRG